MPNEGGGGYGGLGRPKKRVRRKPASQRNTVGKAIQRQAPGKRRTVGKATQRQAKRTPVAPIRKAQPNRRVKPKKVVGKKFDPLTEAPLFKLDRQAETKAERTGRKLRQNTNTLEL